MLMVCCVSCINSVVWDGQCFKTTKKYPTKLKNLRSQDKACTHTLPETNIAPENGWLEYDRFLLGPGLFSGALAVSLPEMTGCFGLGVFPILLLIQKSGQKTTLWMFLKPLVNTVRN